MVKSKVLVAWKLLYCTYGVLPIVAGIDKYFNYLVDWHIYLNEHIPAYLNVTNETFLYTLGFIEIVIGLLVFIKPKLGGYLVIALLLIISINLITMGSHHHETYNHLMMHYDMALHDIALAIGAFAFVLLTEELGK